MIIDTANLFACDCTICRGDGNPLRQLQEFRHRGLDLVALLVLHERLQALCGLRKGGKSRRSTRAFEPMGQAGQFGKILACRRLLHGGKLGLEAAG